LVRGGITAVLPAAASGSSKRVSARERCGFSVAEVAGQVGVSQTSIYFWEGGRVRPRIENLKVLCKVLKLPVRNALEATGV
jgi:DNA-binding XRE family transcriptional regulator